MRLAHSYCGFHDSVLKRLEYKLNGDASVTVEFEIEDIALRFEDVRIFESNISDTISTFFYGINFYVTDFRCYGKFIVMQTDNDLVKIMALKSRC